MIVVRAVPDFLLRNLAVTYLTSGLSVVVVNRNKAAIHKWTSYQQCRTTIRDLRHQLSRPQAFGIAIICGAISGNIEVIDIDEKNALQGGVFETFLRLVSAKDSDLVEKLAIATTKNKGYHLVYKYTGVQRCQPLAKRYPTAEELLMNPKERARVLIETRGTDGYFLVYPTPGYHFIQRDLFQLTELNAAERKCLFEVAGSFNTYQERLLPVRAFKVVGNNGNYGPFKAYNESGDVIALLQRHGWSIVRRMPEVTIFRRPGNTDHHSSGNFNHRLGWFSVFTTSTDFVAHKAYQPYAVFAVLECNGNFSLAKNKLLELGYT